VALGYNTNGEMSFLNMPPSPAANGMAGVLMMSAVHDPFSPMINPGIIGLMAQQHRLTAGFYPERTEWIPNMWFESNYRYSSRALNLGISRQRIERWAKQSFPFGIGLGYNEVNFDYGEIPYFDDQHQYLGTVDSWANSKGVSVGAGYDGVVQAGIGLSSKYTAAHYGISKGTAIAHDIGLVVQLPVMDLLRKPNIDSSWSPFFVTPRIAYAMTSIGKARYEESLESSPLARTGRMTLGLAVGVTLRNPDNSEWAVVSLEAAIQGEDGLVFPDQNSYRYLMNPLGDIHVFKDLILGKRNKLIEKTKGWEISLLEVISFRRGAYEGAGNGWRYETEGIGIRSGGIFKLVRRLEPRLSANRIINFLTDHLEVEYSESKWAQEKYRVVYGYENPYDGTKYQGLSISIR
jgi:hypothetical protein